METKVCKSSNYSFLLFLHQDHITDTPKSFFSYTSIHIFWEGQRFRSCRRRFFILFLFFCYFVSVISFLLIYIWCILYDYKPRVRLTFDWSCRVTTMTLVGAHWVRYTSRNLQRAIRHDTSSHVKTLLNYRHDVLILQMCLIISSSCFLFLTE